MVPLHLPSGARFSKLLIAAAGAVLAAAMVGGAFRAQVRQRQQLQQELALRQQEIAALSEQHQALIQEVESLRAGRETSEEQIAGLKKELTTAAEELERSGNTVQDLLARVETLQGERRELEVRVGRVTTERDEAQRTIQDLEQGKADLERSVSRIRERLALLDRDYRRLLDTVSQSELIPHPGVNVISSSATGVAAVASAPPSASIPGTVELPPIVVRRSQAGISLPVRGRLVEVNEPHRFVVIDKGSMDGVYAGMTFDVLRGRESIGRATVVRVRPHIAACDIVPTQPATTLQVGDEAVQRGR